MPRLLRLYIRNTVIGFVAAAVFVAAMLWLDVAGLWHLVSSSDAGALAVFMLVAFHGIVFSGVQCGVAVMRLAEDDGGKGGGSRVAGPDADRSGSARRGRAAVVVGN